MLDERMPPPRHRVLLSGIIANRDASIAFDCTIRDIGPAGARVKFSEEHSIPASAILIDVTHQIGHAVDVVWQDGGAAGLHFRNAFDVTNPQGEYGILRALVIKKKLLHIETLVRKGEPVEQAVSAARISPSVYGHWVREFAH